MQTIMMSCHLIPTWHKWNANTGDAMVTWFASYANLVMSHWACTSHMCVHGAHTITKVGTLKYFNGLMGTPANSNLRKLTTSHFVKCPSYLGNENMPIMFLIVYLNENLRYFNKNLA